MALVAAEHRPSSLGRVIAVQTQHGIVGAMFLIAMTVLRADEPARILEALGPSGPLLIVLFFALSAALSALRFKLTEEIFVNMAMTAYMAMFPLLGLVISAWIAVAAAATHRIVAIFAERASTQNPEERRLTRVRLFALFATYGIPLVVAASAYEALGGTIPQLHADVPTALRIAACGVLLIVTNNVIVARVERAYGYSWLTTMKTAIVDTSIYLVTIPYAILTTFAYGAIGWGGILASGFTAILATVVGRNLAHMRGDRDQLIQRLTSLTNIGKTISLDCSTDELLARIYDECRKVIDVPVFNIALHDAATNELRFDLNVVLGVPQPKERLPLGDGLNSWIVRNGRPLLLGTAEEERKLGINPYDDGMNTQSWLGVPMIVRDHVIGVISVQSFEKTAFTEGDLVLLTAIANQAAAAIENANLYRHLEGLNVALEQRVNERTNELRETNIRLVAADRSKNQFLATMSHELRTPLNAVIGFSTILLQSTQTLLPPRFYKFLDNINTSGTHLLTLINDILDLAKVEAGKIELEPRRFAIADTVAAVDRVIKGVAAERGITVVTRVDPELTDVHLDEGRVKQILLNLLSNAVTYSPPNDYVHLNVARDDAGASPLGCESVRIEVTDAGEGIPLEDQSRIFEAFYQVSGRRQKGGTGLGLSLTLSFVELHGGRIAVRSEPGRGATFRIDLPRYYVPNASPTSAISPSQTA